MKPPWTTTNPDRYYRSSGAVPATSTLTMLGGGIVVSTVLGLLVQLLNHYLSYDIVRLISTFFFGALVGLTVQFSARIAHVRSPGFARFVGTVIGLFAVYAAWVWFLWINSRFNNQWLTIAVSEPQRVIHTIDRLGRTMVYEIGSMKLQGWQLYAIWSIEALMIVGFAAALSGSSRLTYCEDCRRWTKKRDMLLHLPLTDERALQTDLEQSRYGALSELAKLPYDENDRLDVTVASCPACTNSNFLTVLRATVVDTGNGPQVRTRPVVKDLIVPHEIIEPLERAAVLPRTPLAGPEQLPEGDESPSP